MAVSWLIYVSKRNIGKTSLGINRTYEIIGAIQHLLLTVSESGSESYRYLESGDRQAALRLQSAHGELQQGLDSLQRFTRKNCDQDANINLLYQYILAKTSYEDSLLALHPLTPGPLPTNTAKIAERYLATSASSLTAFTNGMITTEKKLLADRKQLNDDANLRTAYGALVGRIAGCIFVVIILIRLNRDISQRKKSPGTTRTRHPGSTGGQTNAGTVPRQYEPRDPYPHERHQRHDRPAHRALRFPASSTSWPASSKAPLITCSSSWAISSTSPRSRPASSILKK